MDELDEIEVKIRIFCIEHDGMYIDLINGTEGNIILHSDIDERGMQINLEQIRLAIRKLTAK